jgi:hypothetical protein
MLALSSTWMTEACVCFDRSRGVRSVNALFLVDKAGELKSDSDVKDLGLIISLYFKFGNGMEAYGIDEDDLAWRPLLLAFAQKAGIDLVATGCRDIEEIIEEVESDSDDDVSPDMLKNVDKRSSWLKTVSGPSVKNYNLLLTGCSRGTTSPTTPRTTSWVESTTTS